MRAFVSGQIGVDKGQYLNLVQKTARDNGIDLAVCHLGQMMYAEAPDVPQGRILNLPITRLNTLRRAAFKEVLKIAERHEHVLLNTHATFRWRHGLFAAFDFDQIKEFNADLYVTMLDNAESVHQRMLKDHDIDHSLKDIMVWREEEILATEILANIISHGYVDHAPHVINVRLTADDRAIHVVIEDNGRPFNPLTWPPPDLDLPLERRPVGGLGLHIARSVVDAIEYRRDGEKNVLTFSRRTPPISSRG